MIARRIVVVAVEDVVFLAVKMSLKKPFITFFHLK